jgi:thiol-disulfide isomerase/thioredoxin
MKKLLLSLLAIGSINAASAQLASGSVCPNFTGTDLNGNTYTLYDLLDQGKAVVIDVSATWCGPCWNYHNTGALETLHEEHGPNGTNDVVVLFIEGDAATTLADLNGTGNNTQGNWVENTPYPIIDDADIADILEIGYFPTIYTVCPSRIVTETGQLTAAGHYAWIQENNCQAATLATDPALLAMTTESSCAEGTIDVTVQLQNFGTTPLTAATITVTGGATPLVYNWTGNLATYATEDVNVGTISADNLIDLTATITSTDGDVENSVTTGSGGVAPSTTHIRIDWLFDNWPEEVSWTIEDENGTVVASRATGFYDNQTTAMENVYVPSTGCYRFTFTDAFGDGLFGSQYGTSIDGHCFVYSINADGSAGSAIYTYNGDYNFGTTANVPASESADANVNQVVTVEETTALNGLNVFPNPTADVLNINYSLVNTSSVRVDVYNALGALVMSENSASKVAGAHTSQLDFSALNNGMYMVNINVNGQVTTVRVNVSK